MKLKKEWHFQAFSNSETLARLKAEVEVKRHSLDLCLRRSVCCVGYCRKTEQSQILCWNTEAVMTRVWGFRVDESDVYTSCSASECPYLPMTEFTDRFRGSHSWELRLYLKKREFVRSSRSCGWRDRAGNDYMASYNSFTDLEKMYYLSIVSSWKSHYLLLGLNV